MEFYTFIQVKLNYYKPYIHVFISLLHFSTGKVTKVFNQVPQYQYV